MDELARQFLHMIFGGLLILFGLAAGRSELLLLLCVLAACGLVLTQLKFQKFKLPVIDGFLVFLDRNEKIPARGGLSYVSGVLFLVAASNFNFALGVIAILAFGDGMATVVGISGKHRLPYNKKKTFEGLVAFNLAAIASSMFFLGLEQAVLYSLIFSVIESIDSKVDDNLLIPFSGVVLKALLK